MTEVIKQPNHRWLRFSLRTFLIVITILTVCFGWWVYRAERQRAAVRWVKENGGTVYYDFEFDSEGVFAQNRQSPVPEWLLNILDVNYFSNVVYLNISGPQVTDLTPLADLTNLNTLAFIRTPISDLKPSTGITNLVWSSLQDNANQVSDLTPLAGLTNLKGLYLFLTQVSDEEIVRLQQALPNCDIVEY